MKKFIYCHFSLFGVLYFFSIIYPCIFQLASAVYVLIDSFIYYRDFKNNGKSEYAKAVFVYDIIVFCYSNASYFILYLYNFISILIDGLGKPATFYTVHVMGALLLQVVYFIARGLVHKKVFLTGKKVRNTDDASMSSSEPTE